MDMKVCVGVDVLVHRMGSLLHSHSRSDSVDTWPAATQQLQQEDDEWERE